MQRFARPTIGTLIVLLCAFAVAQESRRGTVDLNSILDALEKTQAGVHPGPSYQVIREYQLFGANDAKAKSDVVAEVDFRPPASKDYRIQKASGNNRGEEVVRRLLEHEVEAASGGKQARTALNRDNYNFSYEGESVLDGQPCYVLELKPKRKETELVSGEAWIDEHSFRVRQIEGEVAKTPSWWLKKVHVKLSFADVSGNWLQTRMEAVADVRVVGSHTLTSRILDYRDAAEVASNSSAHPKSDSGKRRAIQEVRSLSLSSIVPF
jgi:hypothetical protein